MLIRGPLCVCYDLTLSPEDFSLCYGPALLVRRAPAPPASRAPLPSGVKGKRASDAYRNKSRRPQFMICIRMSRPERFASRLNYCRCARRY
ncbi:hypothetical protein EVAR_35339_1 [Eumeta japonica]|uniref:Uncharacterized protein n=1 Tax=Eumeta variegata TaxID=151549 RepID=A0A4C1XMD8_EUMVA|nr:hypothetical protein EVAR_35339_1 [Eumeta japonica]